MGLLTSARINPARNAKTKTIAAIDTSRNVRFDVVRKCDSSENPPREPQTPDPASPVTDVIQASRTTLPS